MRAFKKQHKPVETSTEQAPPPEPTPQTPEQEPKTTITKEEVKEEPPVLTQDEMNVLGMNETNRSNNEYDRRVESRSLDHEVLADYVQVKVEVYGYEKKDSGFFSSGYINYFVHIAPQEWNCKRRLSDFAWLKDFLRKQYPGILVPPMSNTKEVYDPKKILRNMRFIEVRPSLMQLNLVRNSCCLACITRLLEELKSSLTSYSWRKKKPGQPRRRCNQHEEIVS